MKAIKASDLRLFIGIPILIFYIWKLDVLSSLITLKSTINMRYLVPPLLLMALFPVLRATRWWYVTRRLQIARISFFESFVYTSASFYVSLATPGKVGEVSRAIFMKSDRTKVLGGVTIEYLFDSLVLLLIPLFFSIVYVYNLKFFIEIIVVLLTVFIVLFFLFRSITFGRVIMALPHGKQLIENKMRFIETMKTGFMKFDVAIFCFFSSFLIYLAYYLAGYFMFVSMGIDIKILHAIGGLSIGQLVGVVTFLPMGLGTREIGSLGFFVFMGYDANVFAGLLIVVRLLTLLPVFIGFIFYNWVVTS